MMRTIKNVVRHLLDRRNLTVVPKTARNGAELPVLELLVDRVLAQRPGGSVLQIGANDGLLADPVHALVRRHNLPIVLVEPLPDVFGDLCRNYADHAPAVFVNAAIATKTGEATIYRIRRDADHLPDWVRGIASFHRSVLLKHRNWDKMDPRQFEAAIETLTVPVLTVDALLAREPVAADPIVLQIDTEGHDLEVLRSAEAAGVMPPIIAYEHKHLSLPDQESARALLAARGYTFFTNENDTVAFRG